MFKSSVELISPTGPNTFSGITTFTAAVIQTPVALNIVSTSIATNAQLGNGYYVTLAPSAATTMSAPSNPADGQIITYELLQPSSGTGGTVTWDAAFDFGNSGAPVLTTVNNKYDLVGFRYSSRKGAWLYLGSQLGF